VDTAIQSRLTSDSETVKLPYGKLMERLLLLSDMNKSNLLCLLEPSAEARLAEFKSVIPGPVAILGDASSSMSVAIRTATIISSLLTAICGASLSFFNTSDWKDSLKPEKISDVLQLAKYKFDHYIQF